MKITIATGAVALALGLAACGGQSKADQAQDYAVKACGIVWTDNSGQETTDGSGTPTFTPGGEDSFDAAYEQLDNLKEWATNLKEQSASAAAAAQLDPAWLPLSNSLSTRTELMNLIVSIRDSGKIGRDFWDTGRFTNSDVDRYNAALLDYETQCQALTARL